MNTPLEYGLFRSILPKGSWLAQLVERTTLNLRGMSLIPTLGVETTLKTNKKKQTNKGEKDNQETDS